MEENLNGNFHLPGLIYEIQYMDLTFALSDTISILSKYCTEQCAHIHIIYSNLCVFDIHWNRTKSLLRKFIDLMRIASRERERKGGERERKRGERETETGR